MNGNSHAEDGSAKTTRIGKFEVFLAVCPIALTALSALWHFLYDLIPLPFIGAFAPVGESVWQHLKIVFYPFLAVWWAGYLFPYEGKNPASHALAGIAGAVSAAASVIAFQYIFCDVLGAPSVLPVHILNCFTSFTIATVIGNRFKDLGSPVAIVMLIVLTVATVSVAAGYCLKNLPPT